MFQLLDGLTYVGMASFSAILSPMIFFFTRRSLIGKELTFTNLHKIYWPKGKIAKGDMINYYYQAAPFLLPYQKDRPQSLNRHPN